MVERIRRGILVLLIGTAVQGGSIPTAWGYETFLAGRNLKINGFLESINIFRSKGFTKNPILTQNRNTAETEIDFTALENWGPIGKLSVFFDGRFFYDGVYDINDNDFGNDAGDPLPGLPDPIPGFGPNRGFRLLGKRPLQFAVPVGQTIRVGKSPAIWPMTSTICATGLSCVNSTRTWSSRTCSTVAITSSCASANSRSSGGVPTCFAYSM